MNAFHEDPSSAEEDDNSSGMAPVAIAGHSPPEPTEQLTETLGDPLLRGDFIAATQKS